MALLRWLFIPICHANLGSVNQWKTSGKEVADVIERARSLCAATERLIQESAKLLKETGELEQRATDQLIPQRVIGEKRYGNIGLEHLTSSAKAYLSKNETSEKELTRLREEQRKVRRAEIFGGFTTGERAALEARNSRIHDLESETSESRKKESEEHIKAAKQRHEWNKQSETDTSQSAARQPYRSREQDSSKAFTDSQKKSKTKKTDSDESAET